VGDFYKEILARVAARHRVDVDTRDGDTEGVSEGSELPPYVDAYADRREHLRRLRKRLGMRQEDLAPWAQLDRGTISRIERGDRDPHLRTWYKLARALDSLGCEEAVELVGGEWPLEYAKIREKFLVSRGSHPEKLSKSKHLGISGG